MKNISVFSRAGFRCAGRVMACALALAAAGCSLLPKSEPVVRYELPAAETAPLSTSPLPLTLAVATPLTSLALSTDRILVMPEGNELSAYKGARWDDAVPLALRNRMILALRESGLAQIVVPAATGLRADVILIGDLSAFQVRYIDGAPVVHLVLDAALVRPGGGKPLDARRFALRQPVDGKEVPQVVQAFGQAVGALNRQVLEWSAPLLRDAAQAQAAAR